MKKSSTPELRTIAVRLTFILASALAAAAAGLNVPAQYPTILAAVNAATNGDTIHIAYRAED